MFTFALQDTRAPSWLSSCITHLAQVTLYLHHVCSFCIISSYTHTLFHTHLFVAYRRGALRPASRVAMAPKFVTVAPNICWSSVWNSRSQWPLTYWVLCVVGRGLCDELITRPEESYRLARRCVWSRNLDNEEALPHGGLSRQKQTVWNMLHVHLSGAYRILRWLLDIWKKPMPPWLPFCICNKAGFHIVNLSHWELSCLPRCGGF